MKNIWYSELKMQDYLKCDKITVEQAQAVYSYRTRMAMYSDNYKGTVGVTVCPLCGVHLDVQNLSFQCQKIKANVKISSKYEEIFNENISKELAKTLLDISIFRNDYLSEK